MPTKIFKKPRKSQFGIVKGTPSVNALAVRAEMLKANNLSLALKLVLENPGGTSRATISSQTGITRTTSSRLVDELVEMNLLEELAPSTDAGRGRPPVFLTPKPKSAIALGLEINVSRLSAQVIDLTGNVLAEKTVDGDFADSDSVKTMTRLRKLADKVIAQLDNESMFVGTGLAIPGVISETDLLTAPNLGWQNQDLDTLLSPLSDLDVKVVRNEADLGAYAVSTPRPGVKEGPASFIYISGEVGIGGGIIIDHQPIPGTHGWSGEIGHVSTDPNGPKCRCGSRGCLEAYIGQRSLLKRSGLSENATFTDLLELADQGDNKASKVIKEGGLALGRTLAAAINLLDVPTVVLGGSVAQIGNLLKPTALKEMNKRLLQSKWATPEIIIAEDSEQLAACGAAHMVLQELVDDPVGLNFEFN